MSAPIRTHVAEKTDFSKVRVEWLQENDKQRKIYRALCEKLGSDDKSFALEKTVNQDYKIPNTDKTIQVECKIYKDNSKSPTIWAMDFRLPGTPKECTVAWFQTRREWDSNLAKEDFVDLPRVSESATNDETFANFALKGGWGVSSRDFVQYTNKVYENDDKLASSQGIPVKHPTFGEKSGHTRATMFSHALVTQLEDDVSGDGQPWSRMQFVTQTDLGGWLFQSVIDFATGSLFAVTFQKVLAYMQKTAHGGSKKEEDDGDGASAEAAASGGDEKKEDDDEKEE